MLIAKKTARIQEQKFPCYDRQRQRKFIQEHRERNARAAAAKTAALGAIFVLALVAVFLVNHFVAIARVNYEIGSVTKELESLQEEQRHLRLEIAGLRSPERLGSVGREIGLQHPEQNQIIILSAKTLEAGG